MIVFFTCSTVAVADTGLNTFDNFTQDDGIAALEAGDALGFEVIPRTELEEVRGEGFVAQKLINPAILYVLHKRGVPCTSYCQEMLTAIDRADTVRGVFSYPANAYRTYKIFKWAQSNYGSSVHQASNDFAWYMGTQGGRVNNSAANFFINYFD